MIGKNNLSIDASEFTKGMSSSPDITDGGFSNETQQVNLIKTPGVLYGVATSTDKSTGLTGDIIASCEDPKATPETRLFLSTDAEADGRFWTCNSSGTLTVVGSEYTGVDFVRGKSDMIPFQGEVYITSASTIVRWERATDTFDGGATYPFSLSDASAPHPGIVYLDKAYIADGNELLVIATAGGTPTVVLTLPTNQVIVALGIDPGTGKMLLSVVEQLNGSGTVNSQSTVMIYDGVSSQVSRKVPTDEMVTAFYTVGGTTYVAYGLNLGYWNGNGYTFLRRFKNVTLVNTDLAYKHHFTNISNTLYVVDGRQILAFGEIIPGQKRFYYAHYNNQSANKGDCVVNIGNNLLALAYATAKFDTFDVSGATIATSVTVYSNRYSFPRPVYIRRAYIEYSSAVANNDSTRSLSYMTQDQRLGFVACSSLTNSSGNSVYEIDDIKGFTSDKIKMLQLQYVTGTAGIRRIVVYYDVAE